MEKHSKEGFFIQEMQSQTDKGHSPLIDFGQQNKRSSQESPWKEIKDSIRLSEESQLSGMKLLPKNLKASGILELHSKSSEETSIESPLMKKRQNNRDEASGDKIFSVRNSTSNATIFSCKQGGNSGNSLHGNIKRTRTKLNRSYSAASSLKRSNAIKSKQGGWLYRLKIVLSQFIKKMKYWKSTFLASSKRTGSAKKPSVKLRMKGKLFPFKRSAGILRRSTREKTEGTLGDEDKFIRLHKVAIALSPSIPEREVNESHSPSRANSYFRLPQRQEFSMSPLIPTNNLSVSPSRSLKSAHLQSDVSVAATAPPPPPHLIPIKHSPTFKFRERAEKKERFQELWNSYLKQVIIKRIQLRQEISYYQKALENHGGKHAKNSLSDPTNVYDIESDIDRSDDDLLDNNAEDDNSEDDNSLVYSTAEFGDDETLSLKTEKSTSRYVSDRFNRQSVLGEMLGLNSPDAILIATNTNTEASGYFTPFATSEIQDSPGLDYAFGLGKSYSTLRRTLMAPYMRT